MDNLSQYNEVFFEEAQEHLETMETLLLAYNIDSPDMEELNSVFRAAHSIKGGSDIFGFKALTGLTHVMENMLDSARNNELTLTTDLITVLLETTDVLKNILSCYREEAEIDWDIIEASKARLSATLQEVTGSNNQVHSPLDEEEDLGYGFFDDDDADTEEEQGFGFFEEDENDSEKDQGFGFFDEDDKEQEQDQDSKAIDEESLGYGFFEENNEMAKEAESLTTEPQPDANTEHTENIGYGFFNEEFNSPQKDAVTAQPAGLTSSTVAKPTPSSKASETKAEATSIRVETNKIDKLVNLVGELVITQSMLNLIGSEVPESIADKMQSALIELERNTREIQEAVMSVRMLPISFVFNRFPRLVRDLSTKLEKKINLVIEGGNTEIDKNLVEKISDPLLHLIRNSVDHGIELPAKRLEANKSETGIVMLSAAQKGGEIVITITDDGAGLNRERIIAKAVEKGISLPEPLSDSAVWQLIFEAGFSTAAEVTDVSGRGVGMDVVRRNIESLGGRIDISSTAGMGTVFTINLPLTLAILDGMTVEASDQVFIIPLVNIVESIQPVAEQIKHIKGKKLLWVRDEYWPLIDIGKTLGGSPNETNMETGIVVLVETSKQRFGLIIDSLLGQQQVVIKNLERHYRRVEGIAGATIMGDGSVALILDVDSITQFIKSDL
ncbi:chemotaxis protein CheA [Marinomonas sp. UCMA 3892]|jgi:two-component system, chemotaxis family, sensor kinase CheA|uniref:chemotaxis protein CheA n=1 Tax=unclassified Marinomonas TaxID=196814 RepID=UPI00146D05A4|nr:chemotaxis protein CheA [Marinomonas sp. UCMA 3892]NLU99328.1 chemotaxis protein CheA [Marinomonas sp. UCMA 3892]